MGLNPYVLIATHQRMSITRDNIKAVLSCGVNVILVVSDLDEFRVFKQLFPDISIIQQPNSPLGLKWQSGIEAARALKADPLIINGSDDILCPEYFIQIGHLMKEGFHFVGLQSWYVYDMKIVYKLSYLAKLPLGGGRAYSYEMLKKINFSVFDPSRDRQLDDLGYGNVLNSGLKYKILNEPLILSVKGSWSMMNPTHKLFGSANVKKLSTHRPEDILKQFKICVV